MHQSYAWQQATAANNIVQLQQPHAPRGHAQTLGDDKRMQGKPNKRLKQKTKPLGKHDKGQPTKAPEDFYKAMPEPKGAQKYPARPTQEDQRSKMAQAAAMAAHDGLDASMPLDQRKMLYGNAKPKAAIGPLYHKHQGI